MRKSIGPITLMFLILGTGSSARADVDALLGFDLDFWDYVTFASMAVIVMSGLVVAVLVLGLGHLDRLLIVGNNAAELWAPHRLL